MSRPPLAPAVTESFSTAVNGVGLCAEPIGGGWRVRFGSTVVDDPFIDHAIAKAVAISPSQSVEIVLRLFPHGGGPPADSTP
jgi:hypothetical protein